MQSIDSATPTHTLLGYVVRALYQRHQASKQARIASGDISSRLSSVVYLVADEGSRVVLLTRSQQEADALRMRVVHPLSHANVYASPSWGGDMSPGKLKEEVPRTVGEAFADLDQTAGSAPVGWLYFLGTTQTIYVVNRSATIPSHREVTITGRDLALLTVQQLKRMIVQRLGPRSHLLESEVMIFANSVACGPQVSRLVSSSEQELENASPIFPHFCYGDAVEDNSACSNVGAVTPFVTATFYMARREGLRVAVSVGRRTVTLSRFTPHATVLDVIHRLHESYYLVIPALWQRDENGLSVMVQPNVLLVELSRDCNQEGCTIQFFVPDDDDTVPSTSDAASEDDLQIPFISEESDRRGAAAPSVTHQHPISTGPNSRLAAEQGHQQARPHETIDVSAPVMSAASLERDSGVRVERDNICADAFDVSARIVLPNGEVTNMLLPTDGHFTVQDVKEFLVAQRVVDAQTPASLRVYNGRSELHDACMLVDLLPPLNCAPVVGPSQLSCQSFVSPVSRSGTVHLRVE